MDLLTPSIGLIFWTGLVFILLVLILKKWAWKPILNAINERETTIANALNQVKLAKQEMKDLKADNERIIREAKLERERILKEARDIKEKIVGDAKDIAQAEASKMIDQARNSIAAEKNAAMADIKKQIGELSVNIAETILKQKLDNEPAQSKLVEEMLNKTNLN